MRVDVVTLFPEMLAAVTEHGITGRAVAQGRLEVATWNLRDHATDRHRTVDDRPYGGGPGMVMQVAPLLASLREARAADQRPATVIHPSPQGRPLDQAGLRELAGRERLIILAGRYDGIDERLLEAEVDEEWSIGDYVLSGGELAAMVMIDGVARLLPGVLGHEDSAAEDSFATGLLDHPHYTRPEEVLGRTVPDVLRSGDHAAIARWRRQQALGRTWQRRPDLLEGVRLTEADRDLLAAWRREQGLDDESD